MPTYSLTGESTVEAKHYDGGTWFRIRRLRSAPSRSRPCVYVAILPLLGAKPPLVLFTATAAALTSWRGFGPGVLASSLGTSVSSSLFVHPFQGLDGRSESVPVETLVMLTGSLFVCWLVYRRQGRPGEGCGGSRSAQRCAGLRVARAAQPALERAARGGDAGARSLRADARARNPADSAVALPG